MVRIDKETISRKSKVEIYVQWKRQLWVMEVQEVNAVGVYRVRLYYSGSSSQLSKQGEKDE